MSDTNDNEPSEEGTVVIPRVLDRPHLSLLTDGNGFIHLQVGNHDEDGKVSIIEDFVVVPAIAEQMGDGLFKAAQIAKPLYDAWLASLPDTPQDT